MSWRFYRFYRIVCWSSTEQCEAPHQCCCTSSDQQSRPVLLCRETGAALLKCEAPHQCCCTSSDQQSRPVLLCRETGAALLKEE
ncbi:hypothetical protein AOLI_G00194790 [Acnodon oligacanthus]